jgi:hypothetical protein
MVAELIGGEAMRRSAVTRMTDVIVEKRWLGFI